MKEIRDQAIEAAKDAVRSALREAEASTVMETRAADMETVTVVVDTKIETIETEIEKTAVRARVADTVTVTETRAADTGIAMAARVAMATAMVLQTEEEWAVADLPTIDRTALEEAADRVQKAVRVIAVTAMVLRAVDVALTVADATQEAMAGREMASEVRTHLRALQEKLLPQRIWRRSARKKRDASARRRISAPEKI